MTTLIVLLVLFALLITYIGVRWDRMNDAKREPRTARDFHEAIDRLTKSGEHARKDYMKKHPRPPWDGSKSGEGK